MDKNDGRVVSNFIIQALSNEPITVYGDGSQTRSFCYVDDLIDGVLRLFFEDHIYHPVNLGNPQPISMKELASEIISFTNSSSKIVYKELPQDDPKVRVPDISLAHKILDWTPRIDRKTGLKKTIEYFEQVLSKR